MRSVVEMISRVQKDCEDIGLRTAPLQIEEIVANIDAGIVRTGKHISNMLITIASTIRAEMSTHLFMQISPNRVHFYEQNDLFGRKVALNFPSARRDIKSAGSCYACDRNTACVMHLMRVLEVGLNTLAHELNVPFERRNWENIINDVELAINKINGPSVGSDWKLKKQFYSGTAKDFRYFKDAWRNHAMHYREHYEAAEALTILNHVQAFMKQLADGGLKEQVGVNEN